MDANCGPDDPAAGVDPAPTAARGDWRGQLQPRGRSRVVNIITEAMKKHLRVSKPEELNQLQEIAAGFEKRVYTAAINQSDYLRKLSLKLLSMEMKTQQAPSTKKKRKTQQAPRNAQVIPDQNNSRNMESPIWTMYGPIGWDPTAGLPLTCDWHAQLQPEDRSRIVDMIMETLKTHLLSSAPEDLNQLREIIVRYEKRIYTEATNQSDYMPKISLKMLSMEKTQQATKNAHVISDQNNCNKPHTQASQKRARLN